MTNFRTSFWALTKSKIIHIAIALCGHDLLVQVSEREDILLAERMARLSEANEEREGDDGSEEEEDTGMGDVDLDKQQEL